MERNSGAKEIMYSPYREERPTEKHTNELYCSSCGTHLGASEWYMTAYCESCYNSMKRKYQNEKRGEWY